MQPDEPPIPHHTETDLIDGFRMRKIGKKWVIVDEDGFAASAEYNSPLMLTRKLMFARNCYRKGYRARAKETDTLIREIAIA